MFRRRFVLVMLVSVAWGFMAIWPGTAGSAEPAPQMWSTQCLTPPYCSDAERNEAGELINMDYFTAGDDPEKKNLLHLVEIWHTNKVIPQIGKNEYNGALHDIKYTLNRFPNHPRGLLLMTLYGRLTKKYAMVVPYYEKALRLFPQHALTYAQYGAYLVTVGNIDSGIKALEQALALNPDLAFAHVWLSRAYAKQGDPERAREAEARAKELALQGGHDPLEHAPSLK